MKVTTYKGSLRYRGKQYEFEFRITYTTDQGYRAYIVRAPDYGPRSQALSDTHRWHESGDIYYICWDTPIRKYSEMVAVVQLWSKATVMYIADGGSLDRHAQTLISMSA